MIILKIHYYLCFIHISNRDFFYIQLTLDALAQGLLHLVVFSLYLQPENIAISQAFVFFDSLVVASEGRGLHDIFQ